MQLDLSLLAELAWLDSNRFAELVRRLPATAIASLIQQYDREFASTSDSYAWFPAWALCVYPDLQKVLQTATTQLSTPPERACQLLIQILSPERQGRHADIVERRKELRTLNDDLFQCYMRTR
ncbi:hypothetical protein AGMMS50225_21640 [Betaproteobacteria bacterium]|nr:hypothetical protein AGMMS50225_21640 [Betaproteobacteria bacterium]